MTTLIIGCGYLGQRLGARLVRDGGRVFGTVRSPGRAGGDRRTRASSRSSPTCSGPIRWAGCPRPIGSSTASGSTAPPGPRCGTSTSTGLQNVLDRLPHSVRRFVYASSTGVYGQTGGEWVDEESPTDPAARVGPGLSWRPRGASAPGPSRAAPRRSSCGSRGCTDRAGSCAGRSLERGEPIPGDPEKFLNLVHIDDAAAGGRRRPRRRRARADLPRRRRPAGHAPRVLHGGGAASSGRPSPGSSRPGPGSPEAARDATNKRIANRRMKTRAGRRAALSRHHDRAGRRARDSRADRP